MRKGHKRTQSATITLNFSEVTSEVTPQEQTKQAKLEIPTLLTKSSARIKEKICHVESLNVCLSDLTDPLFTFGKGFNKKHAQEDMKRQKGKGLIVIPENTEEIYAKSKILNKKSINLEPISTKVIETINLPLKHLRMPFQMKTNKKIKQNSSPEIKYQQQKIKKANETVKQTTISKLKGHIKHISSFK